MLEKLKEAYNDFLSFKLDYQKKLGRLYLKNVVLITGVTCIWKNYFIQKNNLPTLFSYKTGKNIKLKEEQIYVNPDKFYKEFIKWEYFDVYSIDEKFYAYKLEDYFILSKEYEKVYVDISIESLYKWLTYDVWEIILLDYSKKQLDYNIEKRVKERNYFNKRKQHLLEIIDKEYKMLNFVKKKYKNIKIIKYFE